VAYIGGDVADATDMSTGADSLTIPLGKASSLLVWELEHALSASHTAWPSWQRAADVHRWGVIPYEDVVAGYATRVWAAEAVEPAGPKRPIMSRTKADWKANRCTSFAAEKAQARSSTAAEETVSSADTEPDDRRAIRSVTKASALLRPCR
jgi:hypothetical protein